MYSATFGTVQHYYNNQNQPALLSSNNPYIGYSDISVTFTNGELKCSFTRIKNLPVYHYASLDTNNYYLLFAYGSFSINSIARQITTDNTTDLPGAGPVPIFGKKK